MKKSLFSLLLLFVFITPAHASMSWQQNQLVAASLALAVAGYSPTSPLPVYSNIAKTYASSSYASTGWKVASGVELLTPLSTLTSTAELGTSLATVTGASGSRVVIQKALGLLGPVATVVSIGMTLNDVYNAAHSNANLYPLLNSATNTSVTPTGIIVNSSTVNSIHAGSVVQTTFGPRVVSYTRLDTSISNNNHDYVDCNLFSPPRTDGFCTYYPNGSLFQIYFENVPPPTSTRAATLPEFESAITTNGDIVTDSDPVKETLRSDLQNMLKADSTSAVPLSTIYPTPQQIQDLTKNPLVLADVAADANKTALQSAEDAVQKANAASLANPTDPALANTAAQLQSALDKLKADLAAKDLADAQAKADQDSLVPSPVPSNTYDADITSPDKKSISELLLSFISGSPLVAMVKSFTVTTSSPSCSQPIGMVYGQELSFDFCRWEPVLRGCGGTFILLMQGFAIFVVVRGW